MSDSGLVVLVTGSSSGFGDLTVKTLARAGHQVFGAMRDIGGRNRDAAAALREWAEQESASVHVVEMDVADEAWVRAGVDEVIARAGRVDVVVNNAAVAAAGPLESFSIERMQALFDTNVFGALRVNQAVLPHMRAQRSGLIIHISSTLGRILPRHGGLYPASKWALEGFAEGLAYDVAPFGIDVAILEPGRFPTPAVSRGLRPDRPEIAEEYAAVREGAATGSAPDPNPPDPQMVADAILQLVELPPGERPLRTVVGPVFTEGVAEFNSIYEQARDRLRESLQRTPSA